MGPDGLSYLDIASETLKQGPHALVNGHWSPAYPALLTVALWIVEPSRLQEFPLVNFVGFFIFTAALWSFTFFLKALIQCLKNGPASDSEARHLVPLGFGAFLWFSTLFISFPKATPDLFMASAVFLAAGICCDLYREASKSKNYIALGIVIGLGYYTKTAMLPFGLFLLILVFIWPPDYRLCRRRLIWTALIVLTLATPYITLLSSRLHRFSIGEGASLNYIWYVNHRDLFNFDGSKGRFGDAYESLKHPPRKLIEKPLTFEFASPVSGTYALWYNPSYWWEGMSPRFELKGQIDALKENALIYTKALFRMKGFVFGFLALCAFAAYRGRNSWPERFFYWLLLWPIAAFLSYALLTVEHRYIIAFFVLFWLALYGYLFRAVNVAAKSLVVGGVLCALFFAGASTLASACRRTVYELHDSRRETHMIVADVLDQLGVRAGDYLASVGRRFDIASYGARCAGARITAEISDGETFWNLSEEELEDVYDRLARVGIKAIIAVDQPAGGKSDWLDLGFSGNHRVSILPLGGYTNP